MTRLTVRQIDQRSVGLAVARDRPDLPSLAELRPRLGRLVDDDPAPAGGTDGRE